MFDYEEIVCNIPFDVRFYREEMERMLEREQKEENGEVELRMKYRDKPTGKELMLFIRKGYKFGIMQMWILEGICETKDYSEEMERDGSIKKWLEVEIE